MTTTSPPGFAWSHRVGEMRAALLGLAFVLLAPWAARGEIPAEPAKYVRAPYRRQTVRIPMRDGVELHTIVYRPRDESRKVPIMLLRTPYGIGPYEDDKLRE